MTEKTKKINNSLQNHNTESKERQRKSHQKTELNPGAPEG